MSCIYGLGSPEAYYGMLLLLEKGQKISREGHHAQAGGDSLRTERRRFPARNVSGARRRDRDFPHLRRYGVSHRAVGRRDRVAFSQIDPLFGTVKQKYVRLPIYPKTHYVMKPETGARGGRIDRRNWTGGTAELEKQGRMVEAQRVHQRTMFDLEMIKSMGYCHGIENYSRHFTGRLPGEPPPTLLDYFPRDFLMFIDESHQTVPQLRGMYHGDRSRKEKLVEYGFRLPSALDNRPLTFEEFEHRMNQVIYVSATPGPYELTKVSGRGGRADHPSHGAGRSSGGNSSGERAD